MENSKIMVLAVVLLADGTIDNCFQQTSNLNEYLKARRYFKKWLKNFGCFPKGISFPSGGKKSIYFYYALTSNVVNCTLVGGNVAVAGTVGIGLTAANGYTRVVNTIVHNFATCISAATDCGEMHYAHSNLLNPESGGSKVSNFPIGDNTIEDEDPMFYDEANDDYRLKLGSPARMAGSPSYLDIGSLQRRDVLAKHVVL